MAALRQPRPTETGRKPAASETASPKLDKYGRDPNSPGERLRLSTDYEKGTGYSPLFNAALADLPRLASGAVCYAFVLIVNHLSVGRTPRNAWTLPISAVDLAELCRANVRDIQRQLSELEERGMIAVKPVKNGTMRYAVSLLYSKWQGLEDYAVWKRRQVVEIDSAGDDAESDDVEMVPISKDAIQLFKRPASVRPGRATRAAKVTVGVREIVCQNDSPTVDTIFSAVVQSGRLLVSSTSQAISEKANVERKGEGEAKQARRGCRELPANEGNGNPGSNLHPRAAEIISLFDPILQKYGSFPLLKFDPASVQKACDELNGLPAAALAGYVEAPKGRCSRSVSTAAVAGVVKDARLHWFQGAKERNKIRRADIARFEAVLKNPRESEIEHLDHVRELLAECKAELEPEV